MKAPLNAFRKNIHSQNGEDGVILELVERIGLRVDEKFRVVEVGAWDGVHLSNTFALMQSRVNAIYIEGDKEKFRQLLQTAKEYPTIIPVEAFVTGSSVPETPSVAADSKFISSNFLRLDEILSGTACPEDYDLLSIDIDSHDLDVWYAHRDFKPKIVVIEINSSVAPGILQWHRAGNKGNSFSSTLSVAKGKGYTLVCHTGNMIFVRDDLVHLVGIPEIDILFPERLFDSTWMPSQIQSRKAILRFLRRIGRRILGR